MSLLQVRNLSVTFTREGSAPVRAVDGLSFQVEPGASVGLVGESGCGKSVTSLAIMGLLPKRNTRIEGEVLFEGRNLLAMPENALRDIRGKDIAMIFQDPMSSLNPVVRIGVQITEVLVRHQRLKASEARREAESLLRKVGIPDPLRCLGQYPYQLSGGMRQRVLIAIALACKPRLLIADEPTTALDVTIQAQILDLLGALMHETGAAMVMITHDMGVVAGMCDEVNVMYAGRLVESAPRRALFAAPRHRYTEGLLNSIPRMDRPRSEPLRPIPGSVQNAVPWPKGCAFAPRCSHRQDDCLAGEIALRTEGPTVHRCLHAAPLGPDKLAAHSEEGAPCL